MTYRTAPRTSIACDICEYLLGDADDGIQHYEDEQHALEGALVQGWSQLADGRVVCDDDHHAALLAGDAVARFETALEG